jgi:hypothetical protein
MSVVTLKDVLEGKVASKPTLDRKYELFAGVEPVQFRAPTFDVVTEFGALGFKVKTDKSGAPALKDGRIQYDDERTYAEMVRERLKVCCDVNGDVDWDKIIMPVAYRAHDDFFSFTMPIENEPPKS